MFDGFKSMSLLAKVALSIGAVLIILGSTCVIIVALFQPGEYKGDGKVYNDDTWDESIEDV